MTEDDALARFGLPGSVGELDEIRELLARETDKERGSQGDGDTLLMKLLCVYLFTAGTVADSLLVWRAKSASMDSDASIDIQLLCGRGLAETREYLRQQPGQVAAEAAARLVRMRARRGLPRLRRRALHPGSHRLLHLGGRVVAFRRAGLG